MVAPARAAAFDALSLLDSATADLGDTLVSTRDRLTDPRDRALTTDLVLGVLRWRAAIDYQLSRMTDRSLTRLDVTVLVALRLGAYQLLYLDRVPESAVVNDSVGLVKRARLTSAAGFVNAILRRIARERSQLVWPERPSPPSGDAVIDYLAVVQSHPRWLVERWVGRYGVDATERWLAFNNQSPDVTLAVNRTRLTRDDAANQLAAEGVITAATAYAPDGLIVIEGRPLITHAFRNGAVLIQDEASQLIPLLVGPRPGDRILDACAAPGGKTVALAAAAGSAHHVVATDIRPRRMRLLAATLDRCGVQARRVQIGPSGPLPFRDGAFDRVLIDAPCSGLGTLRRDPDIRWRRGPDDLRPLARAQFDLLNRVAPLVAHGGRLVYSTCSSEPEENEEVVERFLATATDFELMPLQSASDVPAAIRTLATERGFLRTNPAHHALEAFFGAILVR